MMQTSLSSLATEELDGSCFDVYFQSAAVVTTIYYGSSHSFMISTNAVTLVSQKALAQILLITSDVKSLSCRCNNP